MYALYRLLGTPHAQRLAQAQGSTLPVQRRFMDAAGRERISGVFVNTVPLDSAVSGRAQLCSGPERYNDDSDAGFTPSASAGMVPAPLRAEDLVTATSFSGGQRFNQEFHNPRAPHRTTPLAGLNLHPQSAREMQRRENAARINGIREAMIRMQLDAPPLAL